MTAIDTPHTQAARERRNERAAQRAAQRSPLRTTRDIVAIIRDLLLIIVLALTLAFGIRAVSALSSIGDELGTGDTPTSECVGEVPCD